MRARSGQVLSAIERDPETIPVALRRCGALLAASEQLSSTGSFSWRVATDDVTCSEELYRILELDARTPVTVGLLFARVHPADLWALRKVIDRARVTGGDIACEPRMLMRDRSVKHVRLVARAMGDGDRGSEYIGAVQDVTELRRADKAFAEERAELARLARVATFAPLTASIAHEVNQPLAGIITNAETCLRMLAASPPNIAGARETAHRTIRDGHRAAAVITRLRSLFSKRAVTTELLDLNEVTREVIALASTELERQRVIVRSELAADLPFVVGDRVQLQQVIMNLLVNAADAMSDVDNRPRLLLIQTTRDHPNGVRLSVRDAGIGVAPHDADRVFEPFYTTKPGGMGVGLSVSRAIIQNHRGRIWVTPNDGPGATFVFSLPARSA
jgi:signal transduction histidine kinase